MNGPETGHSCAEIYEVELPLEALAAFIDNTIPAEGISLEGRREPWRRQDVLTCLAECRACYELFQQTVRFHLEEEGRTEG